MCGVFACVCGMQVCEVCFVYVICILCECVNVFVYVHVHDIYMHILVDLCGMCL